MTPSGYRLITLLLAHLCCVTRSKQDLECHHDNFRLFPSVPLKPAWEGPLGGQHSPALTWHTCTTRSHRSPHARSPTPLFTHARQIQLHVHVCLPTCTGTLAHLNKGLHKLLPKHPGHLFCYIQLRAEVPKIVEKSLGARVRGLELSPSSATAPLHQPHSRLGLFPHVG